MAVGPLHLADKSAWEQARFDERARERMHELREAGRLAVCLVSMTELLYSARNAAELAQLRVELSALPYLHVSAAAEQHVGDAMAALAARGQHRTPVPDLILARSRRPGRRSSCTTTPTTSGSLRSPANLTSGLFPADRGMVVVPTTDRRAGSAQRYRQRQPHEREQHPADRVAGAEQRRGAQQRGHADREQDADGYRAVVDQQAERLAPRGQDCLEHRTHRDTARSAGRRSHQTPNQDSATVAASR